MKLSRRSVSILVLVESGLKARKIFCVFMAFIFVSILVLVESGLKVRSTI